MEVKRKSSLRKKGKGLCGVLLALCMAVTTTPVLSMNAYAAPGDPAIKLGTASISSGDMVYFGKYNTYDVPWIVLEDGKLSEATTTATKTLPLLSKYLLGDSVFQDSGTGYYSESDLQTTMNTIYRGFDSKEQTAVADTTLNGNSMYGGQAALSDQNLFPLSLSETAGLLKVLKAGYISAPAGDAGWWWLRSSIDDIIALCVGNDGNLNDSFVSNARGVRPALYLNLDSVLFTSAVAGGKSSTVGSALTQVATYGGDEWKVTLKDTTRNAFNASFSAKTETKLFINYNGAQTGGNEYISAVVEDTGKITHYAKLKEVNGSASGSVEIDLSSIPTSGTLKVFNEQDNGDKKTDYASYLKQVTIPANVDAYDLSANLTGLTSNGTPYAKKSADYSATLTPDTGYTLPANITVKVDGTEFTAGTDTYSYDQVTGNLKIKADKINGKIEIIAAGVGAGSVTPPSGPASGSVSATDNPQIERPDLWREFIKATLHKIEAAKQGETITIDFGGFNALTLSVMKKMAMRRDLTIKMVYYYKGTQYNLTFPAGMPINYSEDIPYYGPLKLAEMAFRDGGICTIR